MMMLPNMIVDSLPFLAANARGETARLVVNFHELLKFRRLGDHKGKLPTPRIGRRQWQIRMRTLYLRIAPPPRKQIDANDPQFLVAHERECRLQTSADAANL